MLPLSSMLAVMTFCALMRGFNVFVDYWRWQPEL